MSGENHKEPWRAEHLAELHRLAAAGLSPREIARRLGRTQEAIINKARVAGIYIPGGGRAPAHSDARQPAPPQQLIDELMDLRVQLSLEADRPQPDQFRLSQLLSRTRQIEEAIEAAKTSSC